MGFLLAQDLRNEDLRSVEAAFRAGNAPVERVIAKEKKPIEGEESALLVASGRRFGVFIVSGPANRVRAVIDIFDETESTGLPQLDTPARDSVVLHFFGDYGMYRGSMKYFFDASGAARPMKYQYNRIGLAHPKRDGGTLIYEGAALNQAYRVAISPTSSSISKNGAAPDSPTPEPRSIQLPNGSSLTVTGTPPGKEHQAAGIRIGNASYPVPVPSIELHRRMRVKDQAPIEIENDIGPFELRRSTLWFANRFYDGEGVSGVGAIGSFDLNTRKYKMRYLPEIVGWSASALRIIGDELWVGLMRQPEGSAYGAGLLRYNLVTGAVHLFEIKDYISTIDQLGDAIYCGTENGLSRIRNGVVTHYPFEPDRTGRIAMVRR